MKTPLKPQIQIQVQVQKQIPKNINCIMKRKKTPSAVVRFGCPAGRLQALPDRKRSKIQIQLQIQIKIQI